MTGQQDPPKIMRDVSFPEFFGKLSNTPSEVAQEVFKAALAHHSRAAVVWGHCKSHREVVIAGSELTFIYAEDDKGCFFVICLYGDRALSATAFVFEEGADLPELVMARKIPFTLFPASKLEQWMIRRLAQASQYKRFERAPIGAK